MNSCSYLQLHFEPCSEELTRTGGLSLRTACKNKNKLRGAAKHYACASEQLPRQEAFSFHSAACTAPAEASVHSCSYLQVQFRLRREDLTRLGSFSLRAAFEDASASGALRFIIFAPANDFRQGVFSLPSAACTASASASVRNCSYLQFQFARRCEELHSLESPAYAPPPRQERAPRSWEAIRTCQRTPPITGGSQLS